MAQKIDFEIDMPRGDIEIFSFTLIDDGQSIAFQPENIFFTVKVDPNDRYPLFQKSLSAGTIYQDETPGTYSFQINPEDTNSLEFGKEYVCDIEVIALALNIKKTFFGLFTLDEEVTHASNEGAGT